MRKSLSIVCLSFFLPFPLLAQLASLSPSRLPSPAKLPPSPQIELYTNGFGAIVGVQQGRYTFIELGGETNWRKIRLSHPHTYGVGGTAEFNFSGVWGLKAYGWVKPARLDFTYGANVVYYTNANGSRFGVSPNLGYKLLGFHFLAGVNLLAGNRDMNQYNTFYFTIRYYAPIQKKTGFRKSKD